MAAHFLQHFLSLTSYLQTVQITSNGKTANALVVDTCPGCGSGDLGGCHDIDGLAGLDLRVLPGRHVARPVQTLCWAR